MSVVFIHPTGNANSRAAVSGLLHHHLLAQFHTAIAVFPDSFLEKVGKIKGLAEINRRCFEAGLAPFTVSHPFYEFGRMMAPKLKLKSLTKHETGLFCIDSVYRKMDSAVANTLKHTGKKQIGAIYAYEDGALQSFTAAKQMGIRCLYDLPIGYWRASLKLLETERQLRPDWAPTLLGFNNSEEKLVRKDEEIKLADHIFVASSFTASTLSEFPGKPAKIQVIPYGFPPVGQAKGYDNFKNNRPLRLLFVGGLSQRKGIANLFEAVAYFGKKVELTVVGRRPAVVCSILDKSLVAHKWIDSLSHENVLKLMQAQDVLIFPSLFEGFGLVITEAMSQGTPVITTERTAGADIIKNGKNGWLTEAGSTESLKNAIENLLINPEQLKEAGTNAMQTAKERPWVKYSEELAETVGNLL